MYRYEKELGLVYDTLAFLSVYFNGIKEKGPNDVPGDTKYYHKLKARVEHSNIIIPQYLFPFCGSLGSGKCSYLMDVILSGVPYSECTVQRVMRDLRNKSYSKTRLAEYAANQTDREKIRVLRDLEHPAAYEVVNGAPLTPEAKSDLVYALRHYDEIISGLCGVFESIHDILNRTLAEDSENDAISLFKDDAIRDRLGMIGAGDKNTDIVFSVSYLNPRHLSWQRGDPVFFLLGCDAGDRLETEHKYAGRTPLDFAQAVSTPVKYDIFRAFVERGSLSAPELMTLVSQSRNSIRYNVGDMLGKGVIVTDCVEGLTHYYRLDKEYIRYIARQLYGISN